MDENISDYSFLNTLVESMSSPVFFKDAKGVFQYCNHAFFEYLGLTKEQVIGHTVYDISPERLADIYYNADEELMNNRGRQTYEASVLYADGTLHDVLFNKAAVTDSNGSLKGLVGIMQDVTQKNEIDRRLFMMHKVKDIFIELNHSIFDFDDFTDLFKAMLEKLITVFEDCNQASVLEIDDSGFIRI
ncbi:MAG: PAS domain S-box protein, partial [Clostridiales bacterium]|nr:PAS domain S-box protein [Clostridiales bacterium]